jgi:hypothetical protein
MLALVFIVDLRSGPAPMEAVAVRVLASTPTESLAKGCTFTTATSIREAPHYLLPTPTGRGGLKKEEKKLCRITRSAARFCHDGVSWNCARCSPRDAGRLRLKMLPP